MVEFEPIWEHYIRFPPAVEPYASIRPFVQAKWRRGWVEHPDTVLDFVRAPIEEYYFNIALEAADIISYAGTFLANERLHPADYLQESVLHTLLKMGVDALRLLHRYTPVDWEEYTRRVTEGDDPL